MYNLGLIYLQIIILLKYDKTLLNLFREIV